jgi:DNA-binding transcriptional LysR family regulator
VVRVSVPDGFGAAVATAAARFRRQHPETQIELSVESRFVDLAAREADLGLRGARSSSPALIERPLGEVHVGLYASGRYLARRLPTGTLLARDFASQSFVTFEQGGLRNAWLEARGATHFPFRSDSFDARRQAAVEGTGIVEMPLGLAAQHPALRRVQLEEGPPSLTFYLVMHRALRRVPRVRGVADAIGEVFGEYLKAQEAAKKRRRPR